MTYRLVVSPKSGGEHVFDLDRDVVLVGRREGLDVILPHPAVGGVHLRLERDGAAIYVIDAGTAGGTMLGGVRLPAGLRRVDVSDQPVDVRRVPGLGR